MQRPLQIKTHLYASIPLSVVAGRDECRQLLEITGTYARSDDVKFAVFPSDFLVPAHNQLPLRHR